MIDLIIYGRSATTLERLACADLQQDWQAVTGRTAQLVEETAALPDGGFKFLVGSSATSETVANLIALDKLPITSQSPGARGGCIQVVDGQIVLAGCDAQGAQYAVYDFCRSSLGVDPLRYWTDYAPSKQLAFTLADVQQQIIKPPQVPILCYFDNDNDELANLHPPLLEFNWEQWQALIDMLVRLKFNAIEPHDHFGRTEYFTRAPYVKLRPDYEVNVALLNRVIDYAHDKGMLVQVSFFLGWHFKAISDEAAANWTAHKSEWIETWQYYLDETPIGRCDIFSLRPRHPKLDHPYRSSSDEDVVVVYQQAFDAMHRIVKAHNSQALFIADLHSEGVEIFRAGLRPRPAKDFVLSWPDDGFGRIRALPDIPNGYRNGIYVHAGYWLNHLVQDPYPQLLATEMDRAIVQHGVSDYCLVNGQTIRHFLLNLELCSAICADPTSFEVDSFYTGWVTRYFGKSAAANIIQIFQWLHAAQANKKGYVELLWDVQLAQKRLVSETTAATVDGTSIAERISLLQAALNLAIATEPDVIDQAHFYHDQVILPVRLLLQMNQFLFHLTLAGDKQNRLKNIAKAIDLLRAHTETRLQGDKNNKWSGWYNPAKARPNNGYPDLGLLQAILSSSEG